MPPSMIRSQADNWSIARSLAFLAATFAIVFGSVMPFAALAASTPGHPMVICSAEGPQTVAIGVDGAHRDNTKGMGGAKCAACLLTFAAALPEPPVALKIAGAVPHPASIFVAAPSRPAPPARAPPCPPSTAPPLA